MELVTTAFEGQHFRATNATSPSVWHNLRGGGGGGGGQVRREQFVWGSVVRL